MKIVRENLDEKYSINHRVFEAYKTPEGTIFVGQDGILGHKDIFIPWTIIDTLREKYINKKP